VVVKKLGKLAERNKIKLLLVDDHEVVRIGLRTLFNETEGFQVVGQADTSSGAIANARRLQPDVVLMDVRLPDGSGVEACREIRADRPEARVIFLTSFADDDAILATLMAGADGFLLKGASSEELIRAVSTVAAGRSFLDASAMQHAMARLQALSSGVERVTGQALSPQEQKVLAFVAEGRTNKEIAAAMNLSQKTVANYLSNVFQKLNVTRRSQAAAYFVRRVAKA
jgi:two-component system, NarL family, response regulator DevR